MSRGARLAWLALVVVQVGTFCMLGFERSSEAQVRAPQEPFVDAAQQRVQMIEQLREINARLKEQNDLLRSGKLQVVIAPADR